MGADARLVRCKNAKLDPQYSGNEPNRCTDLTGCRANTGTSDLDRLRRMRLFKLFVRAGSAIRSETNCVENGIDLFCFCFVFVFVLFVLYVGGFEAQEENNSTSTSAGLTDCKQGQIPHSTKQRKKALPQSSNSPNCIKSCVSSFFNAAWHSSLLVYLAENFFRNSTVSAVSPGDT